MIQRCTYFILPYLSPIIIKNRQIHFCQGLLTRNCSCVQAIRVQPPRRDQPRACGVLEEKPQYILRRRRRQQLVNVLGGKTLEKKLRFPILGASLYTTHAIYLKIDKVWKLI